MIMNLDFNFNNLNKYYEITDPLETAEYIDKDGYKYDYDLEVLFMLGSFNFWEDNNETI